VHCIELLIYMTTFMCTKIGC